MTKPTACKACDRDVIISSTAENTVFFEIRKSRTSPHNFFKDVFSLKLTLIIKDSLADTFFSARFSSF